MAKVDRKGIVDLPNGKEILEVIDWIEFGPMLEPLSAQSGALDQLAEALYSARESISGDYMLTWHDIRESMMAEIWRQVYENSAAFEAPSEKLCALTSDVSATVRRRLPDKYFDLQDEIASDSSMILISRLVNGNQESVVEEVFRIYRNGCWPCGWYGNWPQGEVIAFCPA